MSAGDGPSCIVGVSRYAGVVREECAWLATRREHLLLSGPTGAGKGAVIDELRRLDPAQPFRVVSVPHLENEIRESLLIGHERFAFSGAERRHAGHLEHAQGGTLVLDDADRMSASLQAASLDIAEGRPVFPLGAEHPVQSDVRIILITQEPVWKLVEAGAFRPDLAERLDQERLALQPLRRHAGDIDVLARHLLGRFAVRLGVPEPAIAEPALALLRRYHWPRNVRQLRHVVERALRAALRRNGHGPAVIGAEHLDADIRSAPESVPAARTEPTAEELRAVLEQHGWVVRKAAGSLAVSRARFYDLMRRHAVTRP